MVEGRVREFGYLIKCDPFTAAFSEDPLQCLIT
jgi:hypothetical protein